MVHTQEYECLRFNLVCFISGCRISSPPSARSSNSNASEGRIQLNTAVFFLNREDRWYKHYKKMSKKLLCTSYKIRNQQIIQTTSQTVTGMIDEVVQKRKRSIKYNMNLKIQSSHSAFQFPLWSTPSLCSHFFSLDESLCFGLLMDSLQSFLHTEWISTHHHFLPLS